MPIAAPSPVAPAPVAPAPVAPTAPDADSYDGCYELKEYSSTEFDWENLYSDENGMTPTVSGPVATYEIVPSNPTAQLTRRSFAHASRARSRICSCLF